MRRNKSSFGIIVLIFFIVIIGILAYLYNSSMFERQAPKIVLQNKIYWNLKKPLSVKIEDVSGIKFIRATLSDGKNSIVLDKKIYSSPEQEITLAIEFPRTGFVSNKKYFELEIEAIDASKWNFLSGNQSIKKSIIHVDRKRPELYIINNSYKIIRGGSATVVFKASDENMKNLYIKTNYGKIFQPTPFYKKGYYISLLAWPSMEKSFKATIIAKDMAGNITKNRVRFFLKNKKYRISKITLKDKFLDGKITDLVDNERSGGGSLDNVGKFKFVNEDLRKRNEDLISKVTLAVPTELIKNFSLKAFYPLKNGAAVASFGDHRFYSYKGSSVSEAYHKGLDFASIAGADIIESNDGTVVLAQSNGIYGNNIIISHGLGLYSLYGHTSSMLVNVGEKVKRGDLIGKTGMTGLALGDHLHFGTIVQGIEVRPEEWMDKNWMRDNVFDIIKNAKKIIDK